MRQAADVSGYDDWNIVEKCDRPNDCYVFRVLRRERPERLELVASEPPFNNTV